MPSQWRKVEFAPGHVLLAARVNAAAPVNDRVLVTVKRRGRVYVSADRWEAAEVHCG